jgi:ethanolamine-phosphate cytidylyltransferase
MMHYGHMNAFRQARSLGTYLIAGVCSDEDTTRAKGSPVCSEQERADSARGCKWVDEVVTDVPYDIPDGYYASIIEKYKIDYIVHGDDPCIVNGKNVYESAIQLGNKPLHASDAVPNTPSLPKPFECEINGISCNMLGKFLTIPRTEGISTTEVVGRILSFSDTTANTQESVHHVTETHDEKTGTLTTSQHFIERNTSYLTTARIIRLFGAGVKVSVFNLIHLILTLLL